MLGAVLAPMQLGEDIHLIDRWDPARVLDVMLEADVGAGTGASVFLASILDHPGLHARARAAHPARRAGRRAGAARARGTGRRARHRDRAGLRLDRASVGHRLRRSTIPPTSGTAPTAGRMPASRSGSSTTTASTVAAGRAGEIWSRGPDLCVGYTDPALTAAAFDADGWYRTRRHGRRSTPTASSRSPTG